MSEPHLGLILAHSHSDASGESEVTHRAASGRIRHRVVACLESLPPGPQLPTVTVTVACSGNAALAITAITVHGDDWRRRDLSESRHLSLETYSGLSLCVTESQS